MTEQRTILEVDRLSVDLTAGAAARRILHDVSFDVRQGEVLGLVGESGSGKSVSALAIVQALSTAMRQSGGEVIIDGQVMSELSPRGLRIFRGRNVGFIFQSPQAALSPVAPIGEQIIEVIQTHERTSRRSAQARMLELLTDVGIPSPELRSRDYPHQFSGGMQQRVAIALALAVRPKLLIADEPTTALDVTIQAQILQLLKRIRDRENIAILFITHDLAVVADLCDRVVVMKEGRVVEEADVYSLFSSPQHSYSRELIAAATHGME